MYLKLTRVTSDKLHRFHCIFKFKTLYIFTEKKASLATLIAGVSWRLRRWLTNLSRNAVRSQTCWESADRRCDFVDTIHLSTSYILTVLFAITLMRLWPIVVCCLPSAKTVSVDLPGWSAFKVFHIHPIDTSLDSRSFSLLWVQFHCCPRTLD